MSSRAQRRGPDAVAEAVRAACVDALIAAYEDAGIRGLCPDGRWQYALDTVRRLDLRSVAAAAGDTGESPRRG